ncbi:LuxR C-terminal-related transcriptional regulator [Peptostreptococcus equinus]|uniref:Stage 0 sporulation protein A homolog n=1 Tax=Peptostreptococcus equinus TaxID=3003601 RepID=A0ABY7JPU5_9FIRM|nr:response regulator transcription factor [Peptostreptococcus sp. CBA3647]WAW15125.1 response regulator transcription factor [Peptostreptococcus sp. CBA3647]
MRILLIDDHSIFAYGVKYSLEINDINKKIHFIDILSNKFEVEDILSLISIKGYDTLMLDINIKNICDFDGLELTQKLLDKFSNLKIIVLTGYDKPIFEKQARDIGAYAFIDKNKNSKDLYEILLKVNEGKFYFEDYIMQEDLLTQREIEIVKLYVGGLTREQIAKKIYVSPRTLANHLINIYEKLNVSNYQEMTLKAIDLGYMKNFSRKNYR